ncbi:MAG: DUF2891 family protein [Gemmatimonadetes bacterium]|nr:DUF2891 family protein [Gemmatimonadota bacterium]
MRRPFALIIPLLLGATAGGAQSSQDAASPRAAEVPLQLTRETATWLAALPIGCVDKPHEPPKSRGYLYENSVVIKPDFQKSRAFYGCSDWHSAVNSTWTMVKILRAYPDLSVARLIREKLNEHLTAATIAGEVAFFSGEGDKSFERPYGWAWLLRLHGELKSWNDPDAAKWATALDTLAHIFVARTPAYLQGLAAPMRVGTHANTANALLLLHEYARAAGQDSLALVVVERAKSFFLADTGCAPNVEVSGSDFLAPCLSEAALMGRILPQAEFTRWLTAFLPGPDSPGFSAYTSAVEMAGSNADLEKTNLLGAKSHLIGLALSRAKSLEDIAVALPQSDQRVAEYRRLAARQAAAGIKGMYDADYVGTHWLGTYVVDYLVSARR